MNGTGVSPEECKYLDIIESKNLTEYKMYFGSIGEVQNFLRFDPDINSEIFYEQKSKSSSVDFAGAPLEVAIQYLIGGYSENYEQFLSMARQLEQINKKKAKVRKTTTSFVGQRPNVPAYIAGAPKNMYRLERTEEKKLKRIWMKVTYESSTTEKQIRNRGIIALNLINLLEMNNYMVDFRLFEVCSVDNEKCGWGLSYGVVLSEEYTRMIMEFHDKDIYIGSPSEMNIKGENISEDADSFLDKIGIGDKIVLPVYSK